jgi:hypothetical protein
MVDRRLRRCPQEIKNWLRKCAAGCRNYEDHIMAKCYEATLAKINADEALIAELVEALEWFRADALRPWDGPSNFDDLIAKAKEMQG